MTTQELLDIFKTQAAISKAFGVSRAAVSKWVKSNQVPEARVWQWQAGKVPRPEPHCQQ